MADRVRLNYDFYHTNVQQVEFTIKRYLKTISLSETNFLEHADSKDLRPELFINLVRNIDSSFNSIFRLGTTGAYWMLPKDFKNIFDLIKKNNSEISAIYELQKKLENAPKDALFGSYHRFIFSHSDFQDQDNQLGIAIYDQQALDLLLGLVTKRKTEVVAVVPSLGVSTGKATSNLHSILERIVEHELRTSTPFI